MAVPSNPIVYSDRASACPQFHQDCLVSQTLKSNIGELAPELRLGFWTASSPNICISALEEVCRGLSSIITQKHLLVVDRF
jgi:hypothetical protein